MGRADVWVFDANALGNALGAISDAALQLLATHGGRPVTYTCVPRGSGERLGVDRDGRRVLGWR